jgi:CRP-like cAMP-binding protein
VFKSEIIGEISQLLTFSAYAISDIIFHENTVDRRIYFITSGIVDIFNPDYNVKYKTLSSRKYFGEIGFFAGLSRTASVMCTLYTETMSLDYLEVTSYLMN